MLHIKQMQEKRQATQRQHLWQRSSAGFVPLSPNIRKFM